MSKSLEEIILSNLIHNEKFCRKSLPHIKLDYFDDANRVVYNLIIDFIAQYNKLPTSKILLIEFGKSTFANRQDANDIFQRIQILEEYDFVEEEWLLTSTECWCKDRAVHNAIMESISIIDGKDKDKSEGLIPELLTKALSVTFDTEVGHDYFENSEDRYNFYHEDEEKFAFDIDMFNTITNGGVAKKTLNIILAGCVHPSTKVKVRISPKE